ncbi:MAG: ROK family protein, partial [Clostridia bacterium]|nr:ROK family protein [Clostridia bacterium]
MPNMNPKKLPAREQAPDVRNKNFEEVSHGYDAAMAVEEATRCLQCKHKPCVSGCPVNVRIPEFIKAIAEEKFGAAKGLKDFICLDLCNGVGMSFYINGSVVRGANNVAGQIGDTVVHTNERICSCGKVGCVEASAAFPAVRANILGALERGVFSVLNSYYDCKQELTVQDVKRALDSGDKLCCHYIKESAQLLGLAIANAVNLLNPQCVFLHGYMIGLGDFFIQNLEAAIRENCMMVFSNVEIKVLSSSLE